MITDLHRSRVKYLLVLGILLWCGLLARIVQVQVFQRDRYVEEATRAQVLRERIQSRRGDVVDRHYEHLARTVSAYAVKFVPEETARQEVLPVLARLLDLDVEFLERKASGGTPFLVTRDVLPTHRSVSDLGSLTGVYLETEHARVYPHGELSGHVIGFAGADHTGLEGIELEFDSELAGIPGWAVKAVDARGRTRSLPGEFHRPPRDGLQIVLAIDVDCQAIAEEELRQGVADCGARSGCVIVMDPRTGDILALANSPGYDPNDPGRFSEESRRNRAVTDYFEPGSTFKIITLAAAVRHGVVDAETLIDAEDGLAHFDGFTIRDHEPYGKITFRESVDHSSNICFAKVARRIGSEHLFRMARAFGVGCPSGIRLPGENDGRLRPLKDWSRRSLATIAIGQEVGVTALQLANLASAVANRGVLMAPRIALGVRDLQGAWVHRFEPRPVRRVLTPEEAAEVTDYLVGVVERGTGRKARLPGLSIAGKTGTAQKAENGQYPDGKYVASFVGYAPAEDPILVILVVLDEPGDRFYGGEVAAPVFRRILERMITTRGVHLGEELVRTELRKGRDVSLASLWGGGTSDPMGGGFEH